MELKDTGLKLSALACPLVAGCRAQTILGCWTRKQMHRNTSDLNSECLYSQHRL